MKPVRAPARRHLPGSPFNNIPEPVRHIEQYSLNDLVTHDRYGLGTVVGVEDEAAITVDFGAQQERITAPFSKLTKL